MRCDWRVAWPGVRVTEVSLKEHPSLSSPIGLARDLVTRASFTRPRNYNLAVTRYTQQEPSVGFIVSLS